jgi:hypothetical protein
MRYDFLSMSCQVQVHVRIHQERLITCGDDRVSFLSCFCHVLPFIALLGYLSSLFVVLRSENTSFYPASHIQSSCSVAVGYHAQLLCMMQPHYLTCLSNTYFTSRTQRPLAIANISTAGVTVPLLTTRKLTPHSLPIHTHTYKILRPNYRIFIATRLPFPPFSSLCFDHFRHPDPNRQERRISPRRAVFYMPARTWAVS